MELKPYILPLESALERWSAASREWLEFVSGHTPILTAFLTGWGWRCMGLEVPKDVGTFRESFRVGWREADEAITIAQRLEAEKESRGQDLKVKIESLCELAQRKHLECEDSWYSCPKSAKGCANEDAGDKCTCGADSRNEKIAEIKDQILETL